MAPMRANNLFTSKADSLITQTSSIHVGETIHHECYRLLTLWGFLPEPAGHACKFSETIHS